MIIRITFNANETKAEVICKWPTSSLEMHLLPWLPSDFHNFRPVDELFPSSWINLYTCFRDVSLYILVYKLIDFCNIYLIIFLCLLSIDVLQEIPFRLSPVHKPSIDPHRSTIVHQPCCFLLPTSCLSPASLSLTSLLSNLLISSWRRPIVDASYNKQM